MIKNKNVQVDELDWTTCSRESLPRLHAWEPSEGYHTMTIGNLMGEKESSGGLVIRDGVGNVGSFIGPLHILRKLKPKRNYASRRTIGGLAIFKVIDDKFDACEFSYIPKDMNQLADLLASNYQLPEKKDGEIEYPQSLKDQVEKIAKEERDGVLKSFGRNLPRGFLKY
ncbi:hypothetical protein COLO4_04653 [Corchorus olitorius]|uniref:Uncharacterized protein n=1 Tax=Corchorus olitorius TaxID=93759 RepID=A0A1R3KT76_9ROSI|nr:hypothetical protein COLO4_04653 [Corchorus olitorius]